MSLKNKKILITGASFIGLHLIKKIIKERPSLIRVVNLTIRRKTLLEKLYDGEIEFHARDLRDINLAKKSVKGIDIVFHLAADHGGRGYVDLYQGKTATNFLLDGAVFKAGLEEDVEKIIYASSGCVYPNYLQRNVNKKNYLKETNVRPPYDADNIYGWAKLMGELTLRQYHKDYGLKSAINRLFTVYGPFASESHAVMGNIAKALIRQDPFEIWGDGQQIRNWTYVDDIVDGIIKTTEIVSDATAINLGTSERIKVLDMANLIFKYAGFQPKKIKYVNMPVGPRNRVADNTIAKKLLNWEPNYQFKEGLKKTVDWYFANKNKDNVSENIKDLLI